MKPFRYGLESVLKHARHKQDLAAAKRARARRRLQDTCAIIDRITSERRSLRTQLDVSQPPRSAAALQQLQCRDQFHVRRVADLSRQAVSQKRALKTHEDALRAAVQNTRKLETLRERQYRDWQTRVRRLEQKATDEVAGRRRFPRQAAIAAPGGNPQPGSSKRPL